ncbi:MAG: type II toxin-antitoxin system ParD family antitoxin [Polyangiaceae bacterium]|jgi:antitoxin ParD1/3/4
MDRHITLSDLPEDLARFAEAQIASGQSASVEDALRAGAEALVAQQRRRQRHEAKVAALDAALDEGERSGMFDGNPFASVRAELGLPPR